MAVTPANKIVRGDDLTTVAQEIDKYFQRKVTGKGLSTNDYTTDEKTKLAGIESGAQVNVKPDWNAASGSAAEIINKPTIPAAVQPATVAPLMDGTAAVGSSAKYAKEDHRHPSDTSKANVNNPQFTGNSIMLEDNDLNDVLQITLTGFSVGDDFFTYPSSEGVLATVNDIPADKIFVATYGTTTYAQVKAAADAGKVVVAKSGNKLHLLSGSTSTAYRFSTFDAVGTVISYVTVENNNVWGGNDIEVANQESVENALDSKADKSTTLAGYGITNAYTKTEVDTAITNAMKGGYTVVATLPTASADTMGKIYLVPMTDTEDDNVKEEYFTYLDEDNNTYKWEKLGTTKFDNSDYEERLTAAEITTLLNL